MSLEKLGGRSQGEGVTTSSRVLDDETHQLLCDILIELRLMNIKLTSMSDVDVDQQDLRTTV